MRNLRRTLPVILATALAAPNPAFAWGKTGHRVTGAIAEQYLSPEARGAVTELLGAETLAEASTYADEQRSNPARFWQETASPWHYVTVPEGESYAEAGAPEEGDAYTALTRFAETLRDPQASVEDKRLALRFAVHLVGDLHQPLHAGNGEDRGGNAVRVTWYGEPTNLHTVWDTKLVDAEQLSFTEWTKRLTAGTTPRALQDWAEPDPRVWIAESAELRDEVYPESSELSWDYVYEATPIVEERLSQAGVRLASWLNWVFGEGAEKS